MGDATDRFGDAHFASEQAPVLALAYGYAVTYDNGAQEFYTAHDAPLIVSNLPAVVGGGSQTFLPAQISHGPTELGIGYSSTTVDITVTTAVEKVRKTAATTAATNHRFHILRFSALGMSTEQASELDYDESGTVVFGGLGEAYSLSGQSVSVTVSPEPFAVDRSIPRFYAQKTCNHVLFDANTCKIGKAGHTFPVTTDSTDRGERRIYRDAEVGTTFDHFRGGHAIHVTTGLTFQVEWGGWLDAAGAETNGILVEPVDWDEGTDGVFVAAEPVAKTYWQLSHWSQDIGQTDDWTIYPGCNRTTDHCINKFSNGANYGGFPFVPNTNPVLHGGQ